MCAAAMLARALSIVAVVITEIIAAIAVTHATTAQLGRIITGHTAQVGRVPTVRRSHRIYAQVAATAPLQTTGTGRGFISRRAGRVDFKKDMLRKISQHVSI